MGDWKEKLRDVKRALTGAKPTDADTPQSSRPSLTTAAPTAKRPTPKRYLCVGFDFGTSSTKAVVRLLETGPAYAVPFKDLGRSEHLYLAPTRLAVASDGRLGLSAPNGSGWVEELKVGLMQRPWDAAPAYEGSKLAARPADLAAAYIALVLREVFAWCEAAIRPLIGQAEIVWSLNLGIPARDLDPGPIREAFLTVARAGWHLAALGGPIGLESASKAVDQARSPDFVPKGIIARELIAVIPEVAAGVTTYALSPMRRTGPHLFIDVGATTLDTSLFLLGQSHDGLRYAFLAADVDSERGAFRLHRYRAEQLGRLALARFAASDPLTPVPATAVDCVPPSDELETLDSVFMNECIKKIGAVVWKAKMKDPTLSVPDHGKSEPIQVLLSGGGVRLPLYQSAIWEYGKKASPGGGLGIRIRPFQEVLIPRPPDLEAPDLSEEDWQRLCIAYGLSFRADDIGEFIPPSDISPMPPRRVRESGDRFVGKDQM